MASLELQFSILNLNTNALAKNVYIQWRPNEGSSLLNQMERYNTIHSENQHV